MDESAPLKQFEGMSLQGGKPIKLTSDLYTAGKREGANASAPATQPEKPVTEKTFAEKLAEQKPAAPRPTPEKISAEKIHVDDQSFKAIVPPPQTRETTDSADVSRPTTAPTSPVMPRKAEPISFPKPVTPPAQPVSTMPNVATAPAPATPTSHERSQDDFIAKPFATIVAAEAPVASPVPPSHPELRTTSKTELEPRPNAPTAPIFTFNKPINIPGAKPDFNEDPEKIIKSLRTYERDMAASIRGKGETITTIQQAEQKRKEEQHEEIAEVTQVVAKNSLLTIVSLVLISASVVTLGIVWLVRDTRAPVPQATVPRTFISIDAIRDVRVASFTRANIVRGLAPTLSEADTPRSVQRIFISDQQTTAAIDSPKMSAETFFSAVTPNIPASLVRAFGTEWLLGFHVVQKNEPFIMIAVNSFDNAYSGMLTWEPYMKTDLADIFLPARVAPISTGTSSATSTNITTPSNEQIPLKNNFEDLIVKSKDTRVLRNAQGTIVLLYSFLDTNHLVITTNEDTFREIVTRYLAAGLVR